MEAAAILSACQNICLPACIHVCQTVRMYVLCMSVECLLMCISVSVRLSVSVGLNLFEVISKLLASIILLWSAVAQW